jgi:hypothetical protein
MTFAPLIALGRPQEAVPTPAALAAPATLATPPSPRPREPPGRPLSAVERDGAPGASGGPEGVEMVLRGSGGGVEAFARYGVLMG